MATSMAALPPDLQLMVKNEIEEGEKIMWLGQPRPWRLAKPGLGIMGFAVPWTAFAVYWMWGASSHGADLGFVLFGVPFVLSGIGMLSAPLWMVRRARRTVYVVSDRRAIILRKGRGVTTDAFVPGMLADLTRHEKADGSGDILFEPKLTQGPDGNVRLPRGFYGIDDVRYVERLLRALAARHGRP